MASSSDSTPIPGSPASRPPASREWSFPRSERRPPRRWVRPLVVVAVLIGLPLLLFGGCQLALNVATARSISHMQDTAQILVAGTPYADAPIETLPFYNSGGSVLCMDVCPYLSFEVDREYTPIVADNVARAGWTIDIPDCLTTPDREGPPCAITDEDGRTVALADYWPGPGLYVLVSPR